MWRREERGKRRDLERKEERLKIKVED